MRGKLRVSRRTANALATLCHLGAANPCPSQVVIGCYKRDMTLSSLSRRHLLVGLSAGGLSTTIAGCGRAQSRPGENPFQLGVASGDPLPDGFVIWTRLAPRPLEPDFGMQPLAISVAWEVAADERFTRIVRQGAAVAHPDLAHAVHVEVDGLRPGQPYFYRFHAMGQTSRTGRSKTAPVISAELARSRFAVLGCQAFDEGFYTAHRFVAEEDLDFVYCYGDYIYEGAHKVVFDKDGVPDRPREHLGRICTTLADYRLRYGQYKMDPDLQASHAAAAWFAVFDDHEVSNNWVSDIDGRGSPPDQFLRRRRAAFQAYYEHMPLRRSAFPQGAGMQIYRRALYGDLLDLNFLDTRQFRSDQPCNLPSDDTGCLSLDDRNARVLGTAQEQWLFANLDQSRSRWKVLAQQIMMMDIDRDPGPDYRVGTDSWAGYRIPRARLLEHVRDGAIANTIVLTGDVHKNFAGELYVDGHDMASDPVAVEFVGTSISSGGNGADKRRAWSRTVAANPQVKFYNNQRGYMICDVTHERWQTEFKVLDKVTEPGGVLSTRATLAVETGTARVAAA